MPAEFFTAEDKADLEELFTDRVTIQANAPGPRNAQGVQVPIWSDVPAFEADYAPAHGDAGGEPLGLVAQIAGEGGEEFPGQGEGKIVISTHTIRCLNFYPAIKVTNRVRDAATGESYDILRAGRDEHSQFSILVCRKVSV
jgi:hypothetical protein